MEPMHPKPNGKMASVPSTLLYSLIGAAVGVGGGYGVPRMLAPPTDEAALAATLEKHTTRSEKVQERQESELRACRESVLLFKKDIETALLKLDAIGAEVRAELIAATQRRR